VAVANDVVYATTLEGQVYALNDLGPDGVSTRWISTVGGERGFRGAYNAPAVGRYLYVSGIDGYLYAFDPPAGGGPVETAWRQPQIETEDTTPLVGSPGLDEAGGIVAVGSEDGGLYAYNALTGEGLRWSPFRTEGEIWSTPLLRNGVAYFGSQDGNVYAVSLNTGALVWQFETGGAVVATPLIHKNLLIVGSFDRQLYALGLNDGQVRWQHEADNWWWATPVASGRAIFAPSTDGKLYALDENGVLLWTHNMGDPIVSSPVLLERGLVVATVEGKVSVLRATETSHGAAQEIASLTVGDAEIKAALAGLRRRVSGTAEPPDSVYIGSDDGTVRRVQVRSGINILWCYDTSENTRCN
jgi:outer membrane protein assembly factor BamB